MQIECNQLKNTANNYEKMIKSGSTDKSVIAGLILSSVYSDIDSSENYLCHLPSFSDLSSGIFFDSKALDDQISMPNNFQDTDLQTKSKAKKASKTLQDGITIHGGEALGQTGSAKLKI